MARFDRIKGFFHTLTARMFLGELLIHAILIPVLIIGVTILVKEGYQTRFVDQARSDARLFANLLAYEKDPALIQNLLDDNIIEGEIIFLELHLASGKTLQSAVDPSRNISFNEDFFFGQHDDYIYYISIPVENIESGDFNSLNIGFDEEPTNEQISQAYKKSLYLAFAYIVFTIILSAILGPQLTRPLRLLRDSAEEISSGSTRKQLNVSTKISEIVSLSRSLETMRKNLVAHGQDLAAREAHLKAVLDNVIDGIIITDAIGTIESTNPAATQLFGYHENELIGHHIRKLSLPSENSPLNHPGVFHAPIKIEGIRRDGSFFPIEVAISEMRIHNIAHYIAVVRDITERVTTEKELEKLHNELENRVIKRTRELAAANEELEYRALHDALTDLPNRVYLHDKISQAILTASQQKMEFALIMLDLDRFKDINDTLGHGYGDLILKQVASRLREAVRDTDTVARLGGDEFAILLPTIMNVEHAVNISQNICSILEKTFIIEDQFLHIGASIGIAIYPDHGSTNSTLMRHADVAMYVAKRNDYDYTVYDSSQDAYSVGRLTLIGELRHAIDHQELLLNYQPKIDIKTRRVIAVEALIRWQHPRNGMMMPDEFTPLAEHSGLIKPLSMWVIKEAIRQCNALHRKHIKIRMSVNISTRNLHDPYLPDFVQMVLSKWDIDPGYLVIEITESTIMSDPVSALRILNHLNDMGVSLSIDDFGTGYSSLSYLKQLPVNEIKIDKSFVLNMDSNKDDHIIVRSTIDLAHNMGCKVVAEGVESEKTLELLGELDCDMAQGYHISKPLSATEFTHWLSESKWKTATFSPNITQIK